MGQPPCSHDPAPESADTAHNGPASKQTCRRLYRLASFLISRSMVAGLFSISPTNRISPRRPPSAIATACFFFATSNATNNSLYSPMVRPPCVRLCSVCPSNPRSLRHEGADHRPHAGNMTSSELHSLVSMGGHLGLRDLSARARALMVSLRGKTTNIGIATEQFRDAAMEALAALQHEQLPRMSGAAQVSEIGRAHV